MKKNPPELWVRRTGLFEPIVDKSIFLKAQELLKKQYVRLSDEQLLKKLREALAANGKLSVSIMAATDGMPSAALYAYRFGSLREAFRRVGYVNSERDLITSTRANNLTLSYLSRHRSWPRAFERSALQLFSIQNQRDDG